MNSHLEKPGYTHMKHEGKQTCDMMDKVLCCFDPGEGKIDYRKQSLCTATCREETESCQGYKLSIVFGGCMFLSNPTGKCMRPPEVRK